MRQFFQECEDWDHKLCEVYPLRKGAEQFEHLIGNRLATNTREPFMKAELIPYLLLHTSSLSYIYICLHFSTYRLFIQSFRPFRPYCLCPIPYPLFRPSPPIAYSLFTNVITYFLSLYIYKYLDFSIYRLFVQSFFIFAIIAYALFPIPYSSLPHLLPIPYLLLHTYSLSIYI